MNVKPVLPRITDPNMLPHSTGGGMSPGAMMQPQEGLQQMPVDGEEPHGLFTTLYENKMIVIIIVLVILIIGIFAYVVIRKNNGDDAEKTEGGEENMQLEPTEVLQRAAHSQPDTRNAALQNVAQQNAAMQRASQQIDPRLGMQRGMQQQTGAPQQIGMQNNMPQQRQHSKEELERMMNEMNKRKEMRNAAAAQSERPNTADITVHKPSPDDSDSIAVGDQEQPQNTEDIDISEYMKAAAEQRDEFDEKAVQIMDEQTSLNEPGGVLCGAPTQAGTPCRSRAVVDGRCRRHLGT